MHSYFEVLPGYLVNLSQIETIRTDHLKTINFKSGDREFQFVMGSEEECKKRFEEIKEFVLRGE